MSNRQVIVAALVLGLTAAAAVWWLERFELERMHAEWAVYLERYEGFREWEAEQRAKNGTAVPPAKPPRAARAPRRQQPPTVGGA